MVRKGNRSTRVTLAIATLVCHARPPGARKGVSSGALRPLPSVASKTPAQRETGSSPRSRLAARRCSQRRFASMSEVQRRRRVRRRAATFVLVVAAPPGAGLPRSVVRNPPAPVICPACITRAGLFFPGRVPRVGPVTARRARPAVAAREWYRAALSPSRTARATTRSAPRRASPAPTVTPSVPTPDR